MESNKTVLHLLVDKPREFWRRFYLWAGDHRAIMRLAGLTASLIVFALLPAALRIALWDGLQSHKILTSMLLVFSLLAISLLWSTGQVLDTWFFMIFNIRGTRPIWLDQGMLWFTQIGSGVTVVGIAVVLFVTGSRSLAYELLFGTLTLWLLVELMKFLVHRSRPYLRITAARIVGYRAIGRSFPSGHTSQAFFIVTMMVQHFHFSFWVIFILYSAALMVGVTRMYIGAHYPRDVLAGAILGSAWGLLGVILSGVWL